MLISSSADGTASLWNLSRVEAPVVHFSHTIHHVKPVGIPDSTELKNSGKDKVLSKSSATRNRPFGADIVSSHFFYQDRFVVLVNYFKLLLLLLLLLLYFYSFLLSYLISYLFLHAQASKSSVYMYSYLPEGLNITNDIERHQSSGKYKSVAEFVHPNSHRVTCVNGINSVQSVTLVSATADRYNEWLSVTIILALRIKHINASII